jgi:hypothetical protein
VWQAGPEEYEFVVRDKKRPNSFVVLDDCIFELYVEVQIFVPLLICLVDLRDRNFLDQSANMALDQRLPDASIRYGRSSRQNRFLRDRNVGLSRGLTLRSNIFSA